MTTPLQLRAQAQPDWVNLTVLLESGGREVLTAEKLDNLIDLWATGFRNAGLEKGDVIVVAAGHSVDAIGAFLGAMRAGIVPTVFHSYLTAKLAAQPMSERLLARMQDCDARAVVATPESSEALRAVVQPDGRAVLTAADLPAAALPPQSAIDPEDIAFLQYTSGSEGNAKAVAHSHRRVLHYLEDKAAAQPVRKGEVIVSWLPLYHDLGLMSGLLAPVVRGVHGVLMSPLQWVREPSLLLRAIHEFRGSLCFIPNFALNHCAMGTRRGSLEGVDLGSLEALVCGGEPVRADSQDMFIERFEPYGFRADALRAGYGMAEVVEAATVTVAGRRPNVDVIDAGRLQEEGIARPASDRTNRTISFVSCGRALPHTEVRVVGENLRSLPERRIGEVAIRSRSMLTGYRNRPDLDAVALRDGWFLTGDLGYLADGELYVTGRKNDLIIVGGRNVHPEEIERLAEGVGGVYPGRAVAFGVADAKSGSDRIVLACETTGSPEEYSAIERQLRRRITEELEVALGDVRFVERHWIIKTSSGKNARGQNRDKYLASFEWTA